MAPKRESGKLVAENRRARFNYDIEEKLEAGIALKGSEVKSLRDQKGSIAEGFVTIRDREAYLVNVQILEYPQAHQQNHAPLRERKLLLHRREITKLDTKLTQKGYSLVPLSVYVKNGRIKVEVGVEDGIEDKVVAAIGNAAKTGQIGDGKIFVRAVEQVIRIRTGEEGEAAV